MSRIDRSSVIAAAMAPSSTSSAFLEKRHWWLRNRKIVEKHVRDARALMATQEQADIASAVNLLDAALALSPRLEQALELKARSLLLLRRFKDVADMLQDYIPSVRMASDHLSSASNPDANSASQRVKLLGDHDSDIYSSFKCFSVSDLKRKVMAGLYRGCQKEGQWRYLVLGQACCRLGLMEDAMVLLQTGKRLANAELRRESVCLSDDSFASTASFRFSGDAQPPGSPPLSGSAECTSQLLSYIKLLLRRRTAALAALDAGLYSEAIRHFSKIVDGRRPAPQAFLAECYKHRASAYRGAGRIAESMADCNRSLALEPCCIQALTTRASLLETIRCLPDCLHDLEHLKLLYNSILRDRKIAGPAWKRHHVRYGEIPGKLSALTVKIHELKQRLASGETGNVDYYVLIGLRRGCSRSELERAHLLLCLKHKPEKFLGFIDRCEFSDARDFDSAKDRAKMSALMLNRLIQKGYSSVKSTIMEEEEAAEKQRMAAAAMASAAQATLMAQQPVQEFKPEPGTSQAQQPVQESKPEPGVSQGQQPAQESKPEPGSRFPPAAKKSTAEPSPDSSVFQGVFCRDLAAVSSLLSQVGFNRPLMVKYEGLSC